MPVVRLLPTATPTPHRRAAIQTAIDAHNLPHSATRLLLAMFPAEDEFCGTQELLRSAGGGRVSSVLQALIAAGLLERRRSSGRGPDTYRLVIP